MNASSYIGLSIAILFLATCFYGFICGIYKLRQDVMWKDKNYQKKQSNSNQNFSCVNAFGGDAGAVCVDGGGGGSCS
jgi:hypothetical protein